MAIPSGFVDPITVLFETGLGQLRDPVLLY